MQNIFAEALLGRCSHPESMVQGVPAVWQGCPALSSRPLISCTISNWHDPMGRGPQGQLQRSAPRSLRTEAGPVEQEEASTSPF